MNKKVIVVGAGASGIFAAGAAAEQGKEVIILEKMKREGIKLSITGKGRCNITNIAPVDEFIEHFGKKGKFLRQVFFSFFSEETINFFNIIGVKTVKERGGRIFTQKGDAKDLVYCLLEWLKKKNIKILKNEKVEELIIENNIVKGVISIKENKKNVYKAASVIIATGGKSYPQTGSTGDGYIMAEKEGHKIYDLKQSLVPLRIEKKMRDKLKNLKLRNTKVSLFVNGKKKKVFFGEFNFYEKGITGPTVLSLSKKVVEEIINKNSVFLELDIKAGLDEKKLEKRLLRDLEKFKNNKINEILMKIMTYKIIDFFLERLEINFLKKGSNINKKEIKKIIKNLKGFKINIEGYGPFEEAIITAGGINTKEINPKTMESKIVKNLFFCGEILDIDADTGGYNLQAAFSTGRAAGKGC